MNIVNVINNLEDMDHLLPACNEDVATAEKELGLTFAREYKEYVMEFGVVSANGKELTGITAFPRLNVVEVTKKEREYNENIPSNMYVVESTGLEGIVILQDESGAVYSSAPNQEPRKIYDSLADYLINT